jgi:hypothetical protein
MSLEGFSETLVPVNKNTPSNTDSLLLKDIEERLRNRCCSGEAINITYSEGVFVDLVIQHAILMPHIVICGLSCWPIFPILFHKRHGFRNESYRI